MICACYNIEEGDTRQLWATVPLSETEQIGEYISKDALLEWAKSEIEKDEYILTLEDLIDKINSL